MIMPTKLKKWKLLEKSDASPSPHFPIEKRKYELPNGKIVDDFYVTTLADSVHIIPITTDRKIVMIRMYKQGVDDFIIQFPAGRYENKHIDILDTAVAELEEETGIKTEKNGLIHIGSLSMASTKASEIIHYFTVSDVSLNSSQNLDPNEEIEVLTLTPQEIDNAIVDGSIWCSPTISGWHLLKSKYLNLL